jgi:hypothetical protein
MTKPTDVLDRTDPGDDVLRRFRFQIGYAALKAITLLDPASLASCIYGNGAARQASLCDLVAQFERNP